MKQHPQFTPVATSRVVLLAFFSVTDVVELKEIQWCQWNVTKKLGSSPCESQVEGYDFHHDFALRWPSVCVCFGDCISSRGETSASLVTWFPAECRALTDVATSPIHILKRKDDVIEAKTWHIILSRVLITNCEISTYQTCIALLRPEQEVEVGERRLDHAILICKFPHTRQASQYDNRRHHCQQKPPHSQLHLHRHVLRKQLLPTPTSPPTSRTPGVAHTFTTQLHASILGASPSSQLPTLTGPHL